MPPKSKAQSSKPAAKATTKTTTKATTKTTTKATTKTTTSKPAKEPKEPKVKSVQELKTTSLIAAKAMLLSKLPPFPPISELASKHSKTHEKSSEKTQKKQRGGGDSCDAPHGVDIVGEYGFTFGKVDGDSAAPPCPMASGVASLMPVRTDITHFDAPFSTQPPAPFSLPLSAAMYNAAGGGSRGSSRRR